MEPSMKSRVRCPKTATIALVLSVRWGLTCALLIGMTARVAHADAPPQVSIEFAPDLTYRSFVDHEPTSADKHYAPRAIVGGELSLRVFPFARWPTAISFLGAYAHGALSFLSSQDIDILPDDQRRAAAPNTATPTDEHGRDIDTRFWRAGIGLLYRVPMRLGPVASAVSLVAGIDRWAFSFDLPKPPFQLSPTARYSFARLGADGEMRLGRAQLRVQAHVLLPWSIDDLGDRPAISKGWGLHAGISPSYLLWDHFALVASARVTFFRFDLPQVLPRSAENASARDRYVDFLLGGRLTW
jgi:hypothetical protein